jgi:hypothetical protein
MNATTAAAELEMVEGTSLVVKECRVVGDTVIMGTVYRYCTVALNRVSNLATLEQNHRPLLLILTV